MEILNTIDDAMSKVKEAIDVACKKTGEVVTTGKQKFDVSSLENKRAKDFEKLGAIYFKMIKDNVPDNDDIKELVNAIKEKNSQIKELEQEIQGRKHKRICANCGANIDESSKFCNSCGAQVTIDD